MPQHSNSFLKRATGERTSRSRLGRWSQAIGHASTGEATFSKLKAAAGEVSLRSRFGKMAMRLSLDNDAGNSFAPARKLRPSTAGEQSLHSRYARWERYVESLV